MLSLIRVLEIVRNALFCSLCNFVKYVLCVEDQTGKATKQENGNEREKNIKLIKYCGEDNSLVFQ